MRKTREFVMIVIAAPEDAAPRLARALVEEGAAACVQASAPVTSTYFWGGALCEDREVLLFVKTMAAKIDGVQRIVAALHPYKVPELIALPVAAGSEAYLDWITAVLDRKPKPV